MDGLTGGSGGTEAFPLNELPVGFGVALAMNEQAMQGYAALTETEKEHLILRCRDAGSKEEMERIVASLVPGRIGGECYCQPPSRVRICPVR